MKTILTVSLILFASTIYSQFIVDNNYKLWYIFQDNCDPQYAYSFYIKSDGDTIIGTDSCIKIKQTYDEQMNWSNYDFIRESNGKVFLKSTPQDLLLYDFKATVGDTIHLLYINLVVGKTDTEFYAGKNRKRMLLYNEGGTFDSLYCEKWYEGIGSLCGLLYPGEFYLTGGPHSLISFSENDTAMYYTAIPANEILNDNITFQVYPIPANHKIHFLLYGNKNHEYRIEIMNIRGFFIDSFKILYNGDIEKNIETYKAGIYFYKLYEENKLIKIDKILIGQ